MSAARNMASERWGCAAHVVGDKPAMWRPDRGLLRGLAALASVQRMEADGLLVSVAGVLRHRAYAEPFHRAFEELGILSSDIAGLQVGGARS